MDNNPAQKHWLIVAEQGKTVDMYVIDGCNPGEAREAFQGEYPEKAGAEIHVYPYSGDTQDFEGADEEGQSLVHLLSCIRRMQSELAGAMKVPEDTPWNRMIAVLNKALN
ncbi:MAG: hypothetical protein IBX50_08210 [Marinospirillum sp.]|uniref:hypothetical protein n=1 Tax=Marinospirillum sp. TaxID=2183934 RepID=UPI0019ECCF33|nr:hypothetical protein [Marinospirillum sp.]MBE0506689.1 hypothetical protein [Marinospirillum sp.]